MIPRDSPRPGFPFAAKLACGFGILALILLAVFVLANRTLDGAIALARKAQADQARALGVVGDLRQGATALRTREIDLSLLDDYFAIEGAVTELAERLDAYDQTLLGFEGRFPSARDTFGARLEAAWAGYRGSVEKALAKATAGDEEGARRITTYASSPRFQSLDDLLTQVAAHLQTATRANTEAYFSELANRRRVFLLIAVGGIVLAILFALVLSFSLTRRIVALEGAAARVAAGLMDEPVSVRGSDEIARLGEALDTMRRTIRNRETALSTSRDELEDRVAERTRALEAANTRIARENVEHRRLSDALARAQDIAHLGTCEWDLESDRVRCTGEARRVLDLNPSDGDEQPVSAFVARLHTHDRKRVLAALAKAARGGPLRGMECRAVGADGEERVLWLEGGRVAAEDGALTRMVVTVQDLTERKQIEEQLVRAQKLEAVGHLAGGIAHDFNNLLQIIMGKIDLLLLVPDRPPRDEDHLEAVTRACSRARELSDRLLTFARGGAPRVELFPVVPTILDVTDLTLAGSGTRPCFDLPEDSPKIEVDPGQFRQALQNVVQNAREAMGDRGTVSIRCDTLTDPPGRPPTVAQDPGARWVRIRVRDDGPGIRTEDLSHIFDLYFSTKDRGTTKGEGLGLATTHSILQRHGGWVTVDSRLGEGSTFDLYLPEPTSTFRFDAVHVLVMDDDPLVRETLSALLSRLGCRVETTSEGSEAVNCYETALDTNTPFDVVFLGLTDRGGVGGRETLARLSLLDPHVRAVVSSGYADDDAVIDPEGAGFVASIVKPFRTDTLALTLTKVLHA